MINNVQLKRVLPNTSQKSRQWFRINHHTAKRAKLAVLARVATLALELVEDALKFENEIVTVEIFDFVAEQKYLINFKKLDKLTSYGQRYPRRNCAWDVTPFAHAEKYHSNIESAHPRQVTTRSTRWRAHSPYWSGFGFCSPKSADSVVNHRAICHAGGLMIDCG